MSKRGLFTGHRTVMLMLIITIVLCTIDIFGSYYVSLYRLAFECNDFLRLIFSAERVDFVILIYFLIISTICFLTILLHYLSKKLRTLIDVSVLFLALMITLYIVTILHNFIELQKIYLSRISK